MNEGSGMTQEQLVQKYSKLFGDTKQRSFAIDFPEGHRVAMKPLTGYGYKNFLQGVTDSLDALMSAGKSTFKLKSGTEILGVELIERDKEGNIIEKPDYRVEVSKGEIQTLPKDSVEEIIRLTDKDLFNKYQDILFKRAADLLQILFPNEKWITNEYVAEHLHIPFLRAVWDLLIDINRLDDILPFLKKLFFSGMEEENENETKPKAKKKG